MRLDNLASKRILNNPDKHDFDTKLRDKIMYGFSNSGARISQVEDATGFDYEKIVKIMHGDKSVKKEDYQKIFKFFDNFE